MKKNFQQKINIYFSGKQFHTNFFNTFYITVHRKLIIKFLQNVENLGLNLSFSPRKKRSTEILTSKIDFYHYFF